MVGLVLLSICSRPALRLRLRGTIWDLDLRRTGAGKREQRKAVKTWKQAKTYDCSFSCRRGAAKKELQRMAPVRENKPAPRQREGRGERRGVMGRRGYRRERRGKRTGETEKRKKLTKAVFKTRPIMLFGRWTGCKTTQSGVAGEEGLVESSRVGLFWRFGRDVECELRRVLRRRDGKRPG